MFGSLGGDFGFGVLIHVCWRRWGGKRESNARRGCFMGDGEWTEMLQEAHAFTKAISSHGDGAFKQ